VVVLLFALVHDAKFLLPFLLLRYHEVIVLMHPQLQEAVFPSRLPGYHEVGVLMFPLFQNTVQMVVWIFLEKED
jgi:hypothetical protein